VGLGTSAGRDTGVHNAVTITEKYVRPHATCFGSEFVTYPPFSRCSGGTKDPGDERALHKRSPNVHIAS
jgi:hypothetical protein